MNKGSTTHQMGGFHFETWWILDDLFEGIVKDTWEKPTGNVLDKLSNLRMKIQRWAVKIRKSRNAKKLNLQNKLEQLLEADQNDDNIAEMIYTKIQLNWEIDKDEAYREKRARVNWVKLGDRNTSFFS